MHNATVVVLVDRDCFSAEGTSQPLERGFGVPKVRHGRTVCVMPGTLSRHGVLVLKEWERRGRDACQRAKLPRQVRLVGEAVVGGHARERHAPDPSPCLLEPNQPRCDLG